MPNSRKSFTLIELLVTLAIVGILATVVIITLNPAELLKQARDSNRLGDLSTLNTALGAYTADVVNGFMGTSSIVYVSISDTTSTCSNLGLPTLPSGWSYNCVTSTNLKKTDGTGWIPVNLQNISFGTPLSSLPIDPVNTTSSRNYYTYISGGSYELTASLEAAKNKLGGASDRVSKDGGTYPSLYEAGTNLALSPLDYGDSTLVGYWNFDEESGAIAEDHSGYGNNGVVGTSTIVAGKVGNAKLFSTSGGQVVIDNVQTNTAGGGKNSVSFWMKWNGANTVMPLGSGSYVLYFYSTCFGFNTGNGDGMGVNSSTYSMNGNWVYIVVVFVNGSGKSNQEMYINGNRASISYCLGSSSKPLNFSSSIRISGSSSGQYKFDGILDDIRIYNRALSAAEVLALYSATR